LPGCWGGPENNRANPAAASSNDIDSLRCHGDDTLRQGME
jgi:hypothetical protein